MLSDPVAEAFGLTHRHPSGENFWYGMTKQTEKQHAMVLNSSILTDWLQILKTETAKPDGNFCIKLTPDTKPKKVTGMGDHFWPYQLGKHF